MCECVSVCVCARASVRLRPVHVPCPLPQRLSSRVSRATLNFSAEVLTVQHMRQVRETDGQTGNKDRQTERQLHAEISSTGTLNLTAKERGVIILTNLFKTSMI